MTNEEAALAIQEGHTSLYGLLWNQTLRLIQMKAGQYYRSHEGSCRRAGVDQDDLIQCGFLALHDAVEAYSPETGHKLVSYLSYPLRNRFNEAIGARGNMKREPLNDSLSFDKPLEDGGTLEDFIPDMAATDTMERVIDREHHRELHDALNRALYTLSEKQQAVIRRRFYGGETLDAIAAAQGVTRERVRQEVQKALRELRKPKSARLLSSFREEIIATQAWKGTGLTSFRERGSSSVERAAETMERIMRPVS